ncbi:GNAT family N-acetyltransferase [Streptomyces sp. NPDC052114]|uniref:GNAT family N-acetyltransferase n=1 Tax=unclassified Streptomyces TaxID=2593676 RepID=UPI0034313E82
MARADLPVDSTETASRWTERRAVERDAGTAYAFAVTDTDGRALGNVVAGAVNRSHGTGRVSYWTLPHARGRGVAARGCRALAHWCFTERELYRLELGHRADDPVSCRVARAADFAVEGLQRQKPAYDGVRHDVEPHAPGPRPGAAFRRRATHPNPPVTTPARPACISRKRRADRPVGRGTDGDGRWLSGPERRSRIAAPTSTRSTPPRPSGWSPRSTR